MTKNEYNNPNEKKDIQWGKRHTQTILLFLGLTIAYGLRVSLSVAIVAMTDKSSANTHVIELPWNETMKSAVLSSFFWGYPITQVFVGHMAQKYGAKYFLAGCMAVSAVITIMIPLTAIYGGVIAVCAIQMLHGMAQGAIYPSMNVLLSKWAPTTESARLSSFVYSGLQFGSMTMLPVTGLMVSSAGGWPYVFYMNGIVTLAWVLAWCLMGANSPSKHKTISSAEKKYITDSLCNTMSKKSLPTPWREIFTSVPVWTLIVAHLTQNWGFMILLTNIPNYLNYVLKFDIKSNGYLSALPYLVMWILIVAFSWISDYINAHGLMSKTIQRKMWNSVAHWGGALALASLYLFDTSATGATILLTAALAMNGGTMTGFFTNHVDLAPNFGGTLLGISNSVGSITAILGPLLVGFMVEDRTNKDQWGIVFLCSSCIFFVGNLFYVLFGSAEIQPWNDSTKTNKILIDRDEEMSMKTKITYLSNV